MNQNFPKSPAVAKRLESLYARRSFGIKPGLDVIRALFRELGDPQERIRVVHVAGTDGKGSTCAFVDAMFRAAGLRTGLYTSPHLVRLTERFRIAGREMPEETLVALLDDIDAACARVVASGLPEPTFFEVTTALCFLWFAREGVSLAVAEVGMGGRLDATNALLPAVSVITRIGLDHTQYLGATIEEIALEKAGIAKRGVPLVLGAMPDSARAAISRHAREVDAPIVLSEQVCSVRRVASRVSGGRDFSAPRVAVSTPDSDLGTATLGLGAAYQIENAATAVAAFETFKRVLGVSLPPNVVLDGLSSASILGRFQKLADNPPVWIDGGHNPCAAEALLGALKAARAAKSLRLVCGMCSDKDPAGYLRVLSPAVAKVWTVPLSNPRGLPPDKLAMFARGAAIRESIPCDSLWSAIRAARADARAANAPMLIAGSLFLVGDCLADERSLSDALA